jgi:hypothetical protein
MARFIMGVVRSAIAGNSRFECLEQFRPGQTQLCSVSHRELLQHLFTTASQLQQHLTAIRLAARAVNQSICFQAVTQLDGTVMLHL